MSNDPFRRVLGVLPFEQPPPALSPEDAAAAAAAAARLPGINPLPLLLPPPLPLSNDPLRAICDRAAGAKT